jgi:hypothetical protein
MTVAHTKVWTFVLLAILQMVMLQKCKKSIHHFSLPQSSIFELDKYFYDINLNYYIFESHKYALKYWISHMKKLRNKKLTMIHIDGRE